MMQIQPTPRTWFVTGAGRGLGRAFTEAALAAGDRVVATARRPAVLDGLVAANAGSLSVLPLDVADRAAVRTAVDEAITLSGHLDVVVNNAGSGLVGAVEEVTEADARKQMNTNLFGALWVTQAVLPHMRRRGSGHVVQISTVGAVGTMPTMGLYNASKWALEAFSEALAAEVGAFGIRVTIAQLGGFATDWAGSSMRFAQPLPAYDPLRESLFGTEVVPWELPAEGAERDEPDPDVAAAVLLAHIGREDGPLRVLIGEDAPLHVRMALERRREDYLRDQRFTWPDA